jgi:hypothetical protein
VKCDGHENPVPKDVFQCVKYFPFQLTKYKQGSSTQNSVKFKSTFIIRTKHLTVIAMLTMLCHTVFW